MVVCVVVYDFNDVFTLILRVISVSKYCTSQFCNFANPPFLLSSPSCLNNDVCGYLQLYWCF